MLVVFKWPFHGTVLLVRFTVKHIWLLQQAEVLGGFNVAERNEPIQREYEPDGHIAQGAGARSTDHRRIRSRARRRLIGGPVDPEDAPAGMAERRLGRTTGLTRSGCVRSVAQVHTELRKRVMEAT